MSEENRRPRVLICDPIAEIGVQLLAEYADVDIHLNQSPSDLISQIFDYDAIVVQSKTQVTAELIEHGRQLKVIARAGAGLDNIDVSAAVEYGIQVVNSPDANTIAVAEHTMGLLLSLARQIPWANQAIKSGSWEKGHLKGAGLSGKTLGIVGFGRIGREVAIRAQAFGMDILINQRRKTPEMELSAGISSVDLDDLLKKADFISLHVPSRPETRGIISSEKLDLMKDLAFLINTARGDIIDEAALLDALESGRVAGAALDVFIEESAADNRLAQHPRVVATPHIAASTEDAQRDAAITIAEKIIEIFQDVELENVLPLRIVPLDKVFPHEHFDRKRAESLADRLKEDLFLSNPPITMQTSNGYMVLDGATRVSALKILGHPHGLVQVIENDDDLRLHTWYHVVRQLTTSKLIAILNALPEVILEPAETDRAMEIMFAYGGLCVIQTIDGRSSVVQPAPGVDRIEALNVLTNTYIDAGVVSRTLETDSITLRNYYPDMAALVIFPEYTVQQVMKAAEIGRMFPAGITRFIIPGRVLRVNADLNVLASKTLTLREKNRWLHDLLVEKEGRGKIRFYEEPVFLLDE